MLFYTNATYISMCRLNTLPGKHSTFPWMNFFSFFRLFFFWYFQWTKANKTQCNWHKFRLGQKTLVYTLLQWMRLSSIFFCRFIKSFCMIWEITNEVWSRATFLFSLSFFYRTNLFSVLSASGVIMRWWRNFKKITECTFPVHFWASGSKSRQKSSMLPKMETKKSIN